MRLFDVKTGRETGFLESAAGSSWVEVVAFTPDGKRLLCGSQKGRVTLWDLTERRVISSRRTFKTEVQALAIAPDGSRWAAGEWTPVGMMALWFAQLGKDSDCRAVATDALVEGVLDGRAHPEPLGDVLAAILQIDWVKTGRLPGGLREVARVSAWGAAVVATVLDRVMTGWSTLPRDAHHLLAVQLEVLTDLDGAVADSVRDVLETAKGSSKTAKLAKSLLSLSGSRESPRWKNALLEGVAVRLTRAAAPDR